MTPFLSIAVIPPILWNAMEPFSEGSAFQRSTGQDKINLSTPHTQKTSSCDFATPKQHFSHFSPPLGRIWQTQEGSQIISTFGPPLNLLSKSTRLSHGEVLRRQSNLALWSLRWSLGRLHPWKPWSVLVWLHHKSHVCDMFCDHGMACLNEKWKLLEHVWIINNYRDIFIFVRLNDPNPGIIMVTKWFIQNIPTNVITTKGACGKLRLVYVYHVTFQPGIFSTFFRF